MRSQFLTLLCVLTFLSCALGLFDSVVSFTRADAVSETIRVQRQKPAPRSAENPDYFEDRGANSDHPTPAEADVVQQLAVGQFAYSLLTLIGALLMFRLRRIGFWIYVAGVLVGLVLPLTFVGLSGINTAFGPFFSILFIALYAYCWPELR